MSGLGHVLLFIYDLAIDFSDLHHLVSSSVARPPCVASYIHRRDCHSIHYSLSSLTAGFLLMKPKSTL